MMQNKGSLADRKPLARTIEDAEPPTIVFDLGAGSDIRTDVVDGTLIVVDESSGEQVEGTLPGAPRRTFMQNGVLTIELEK